MTQPTNDLQELCAWLRQQADKHEAGIASRDPIIIGHIKTLRAWADAVADLYAKNALSWPTQAGFKDEDAAPGKML